MRDECERMLKWEKISFRNSNQVTGDEMRGVRALQLSMQLEQRIDLGFHFPKEKTNRRTG